MTEAWSEREQLAADYVLGTLSAGEREAVERLAAEDAALAAMIEAWQRRLGPLDAAAPAVTPPPELWQRIAAALPDESAREGGASAGNVVALRRSLTRQRWATAAFGTLAAGLAALLLLGPSGLGFLALPGQPGRAPSEPVAEAPGEEQPRRFVSLLRRDPDQPGFLVEVDLARGEIRARPIAPSDPARLGAGAVGEGNRDYELWLVDRGEPRSLGVLPHDAGGHSLRLSVEQLGRAGPEAALAVSLEPAGGSPTGQPTGPVVFSGKLIPLPDPDAGGR